MTDFSQFEPPSHPNCRCIIIQPKRGRIRMFIDNMIVLWYKVIDAIMPPIPPLPPQEDYDAKVRDLHLATCTPENCDMSGEDWIVRSFVNQVKETLRRREICTLYQVPSDFSDPAYLNKAMIWPQMKHQSFRDKVLAQCPGTFYPPDELDEWVFVAYPDGMHASHPRIDPHA